jgi:hypothetical protein
VNTVLIAQVTAAIVAFQTINRRPTIDGVVDPNGGTLRLMDQLAGAGRISATVVRGDVNSQLWVVADPASLDGTNPLQSRSISPQLTRKLVSVSGSSIKWFGVVVPRDQSGGSGGRPHISSPPRPGKAGTRTVPTMRSTRGTVYGTNTHRPSAPNSLRPESRRFW